MKHDIIGSCTEKVRSWNPVRDASNDEISYIDLGAIDNDLKSVVAAQRVLGRDAPSRARQLVCAGDILVSTVRPYLNGVARVPREMDGATASTGFCVVRPNPKKVNGSYLFHWLKTPDFISDMVRKSTGASYPAVSDKIIKHSSLPLPPLLEQRRVAAILDETDALRNFRRQARSLLGQLEQALFSEMFGDLRENTRGWKINRFGDLLQNLDGKRVPIKLADRATRAGSIPYYGASGIIDYVDDYIFDGEHLLIGEDGANLVARSFPIAFIAHNRFWVNNHAHVLKENGLSDVEFMRHFIESIDLKPYVSGSAQPKLTQAQLNRIPVPCPPIELQRQFRHQLDEIRLASRVANDASSKLDTLFTSLQYRAFSGGL